MPNVDIIYSYIPIYMECYQIISTFSLNNISCYTVIALRIFKIGRGTNGGKIEIIAFLNITVKISIKSVKEWQYSKLCKQ